MRNLLLMSISALLVGCGLAGGSTEGKSQVSKATGVFEGPVTRAVCGSGSRPEPGLQGRSADNEQLAAGESLKGYSCNLEEVGHSGDGALWQLAWYERCAYYGLGAGFATGSTAGFVAGAPNVPGGGVAVVDVTDPAAPVQTLTLETPAMIDPWESLKVNDKRGLLAGSSVSIEGPGMFDVYDVKTGPATDCATPVPTAVTAMGRAGHEGEWAPDGFTYYSSGLLAPLTTAIDVTNPYAPVTVATINDGVHGLSLNDEGTRLYAAETSPNGLEIWDTSAIQFRSTSVTTNVMPPVVVGSVYWDDGGAAQMTIPVTIKGKPYVIFIDEGGGTPEGSEYQLPGMTRIIDVSDEKNPVVVSKLKNEINMPDAAASEARLADGGASGFTYQGHYCGVPQRAEPGIVACSYFWQGVRVFDIRDPSRPKEIAYFVPSLENAAAAPLGDTTHAHASSAIRLIPETGELWLTNQNTGFHVLKFTNGVWPFKD
jgi:hypothetical protein